jgi:hypothetical protein
MIQVKEFLNYQEGQDNMVNSWLKEKGDSIEVVDIKYSVGVFQAEAQNGYNAQEFSGVLILYKSI